MAKKRKKIDRAARQQMFSRFYEDMFQGRWPELRQALLEDPTHHELKDGLLDSYFLDEASLFPARYLEAEHQDEILDLCAAPGGKSLVILSNLLSNGLLPGEAFRLVLNERSATRRGRLKQVISRFIPEHVQSRLSITGHDAGKWGLYQQNAYDKVLLDVPCSSERHLVNDPKYLDEWSPSRSERLAQQAYSFLLSALKTLKPGGTVVYSTCALSRLENDEVIDRVFMRMLKKQEMTLITRNDRTYRSQSSAEPRHLPEWVEDSALGHIILPDRAEGRGPIYFSRIKRLT
ncbi:tRNA and rRNA cytosine-C5-methylase [Salinispira pacifica]|uniref:NOL1/NOP2/Sun domain family member 4 n=1 Tax=Salinispira pacifica TaxID=1307761 RepID=V5WGI7_9SPIO|nr:tRNA and rRNA cytosine-C5-methylase [Salinispira pacifica]AHC14664.1 tRNA and rRNA cytosine-C5-methylase [Salinispira pacifica]